MQKNRNNKGRQSKGRASARGKSQSDSAENANVTADENSTDEVKTLSAENAAPPQAEKTAEQSGSQKPAQKTDQKPGGDSEAVPEAVPEAASASQPEKAAPPQANSDASAKAVKPSSSQTDSSKKVSDGKKPQAAAAPAKPKEEKTKPVEPAKASAAKAPTPKPLPNSADDQSSEKSASEKKGGKGAVIVAIVALLIALLAVGGLVYLWMQLQQERTAEATDNATQSTQLQTLAGDLKNAAAGRDKNAAAITATQQQVAQIDGRLEGLNGQVSNIAGVIDLANQANASVKVYDTRIEQLEQGIGSLREIAEGGRNAWRKAEIEYLLVVANQRLQVYNDPKTAEAALKAADKRLLELGDAQLVPLRQLIADEITAVKSVERADVSGLAFSLGSHAERVSQLPIKRELGGKAHYSSGDEADKAAAEAAEKGVDWDKLWSGIYGELKTLVVVRRNGKPVEPMLPPAAEFFLEQNLRLKLESARAALLRGDSENFTASLRTAKSWLEAYFNGEDSAVQAMLASLSEMEGVNIAPTLPDISPSLTMLRQINQNAAQ